jgi:hypothetical protein
MNLFVAKSLQGFLEWPFLLLEQLGPSPACAHRPGNALANGLRTPHRRSSRVEASKGGDACREDEGSQQVW